MPVTSLAASDLRDASLATFRTWQLYMDGAQGSHSGRIGLFQSLLCKPTLDGVVDVPPTRHHLYAMASQ